MELPAAQDRPGIYNSKAREHFVLEHDGTMQLVNGGLAFCGLAVIATQPYTSFFLAGFWLYFTYPLNNWRDNSYARAFSRFFNGCLAIGYLYLLCLQPFDYSQRHQFNWMLNVFSTILAAQCSLSIILAVPPTRLLLPVQSKLKAGVQRLRTSINLAFGIASILLLISQDSRFFAAHLILLWLLFNAWALRYLPDANISRWLKKAVDVLSISFGLAAILIALELTRCSPIAEMLVNALATTLVYGLTGSIFYTVVSNFETICTRKADHIALSEDAE